MVGAQVDAHQHTDNGDHLDAEIRTEHSPSTGQASQPKPFEFAIPDKCAKASAVS